MKQTLLLATFLFSCMVIFGQAKIDEDFESVTLPNIPTDWSVIDLGDNNATWESSDYNGGSGAHSGMQYMYLDCYDGAGTPANDYLITPQFTVADEDELSLWVRCSSSYPDSLIILASKSGVNAADFTIIIDTVKGPGDYKSYIYTLTDHADISDGDQLYLAFRGYTNGSYLYIDDVRVGAPSRSMQYAYYVDETSVDVVFDGSVWGEALVAGNYSLSGTENITFTTATVDASDDKVIHLTGASATIVSDMQLDTLVYNVDTAKFYGGITPFASIHTGNPSGIIEEERATFKGIVTMIYGSNVYMADAAGAYNGAYPYGGDFADAIEIGDEVVFSGIYYYYKTNTSIGDLEIIEILSSGNSPYPATVIDGADIDSSIVADTEPAERWENVLVTVENAEVLSIHNTYSYICTDDGGESSFVVGSKFFPIPDLQNPPVVGKKYNFTGLIEYRSSGDDTFYRLNPLDSTDIMDATAPVVTITPANGSEDIALDTVIMVSLDEPIRNLDDSEITNDNVADILVLKLDDADGDNVAFTAEISEAKDEITVTPIDGLERATTYYFAVLPVEDTLNNATETASVIFKTIASSEKQMLSFVLEGFDPDVIGVIDETEHTVHFEVAFGDSLINIVPTIVVSDFAMVSPTSGTAISFTDPVTYTVYAEDMSSQEYVVTGAIAPNDANDIISFRFDSLTPPVVGQIVDTNIVMTVPIGTDVTSLVPTIVISGGATVDPATGVAQDFTNPVVYTVTAQNEDTKEYLVSVEFELRTENDILSFDFNGLDPAVIGEITDTNILLEVPQGTDVTTLVPTIMVSEGATVDPASDVANDFTNPAVYTVTAENGDVKEYLVTVDILNSIHTVNRMNVNAFPNPVNDILTVQNVSVIQELTIYNIYGQMVRTLTNNGADQIHIPLGDLQNGIYIISLYNRNTGYYNMRIIKE